MVSWVSSWTWGMFYRVSSWTWGFVKMVTSWFWGMVINRVSCWTLGKDNRVSSWNWGFVKMVPNRTRVMVNRVTSRTWDVYNRARGVGCRVSGGIWGVGLQGLRLYLDWGQEWKIIMGIGQR